MKPKLPNPRIEIWKNKKGEWWWHLVVNGRVKLDSGEGYKRRATMLKSLDAARRQLARAQIVEVPSSIEYP